MNKALKLAMTDSMIVPFSYRLLFQVKLKILTLWHRKEYWERPRYEVQNVAFTFNLHNQQPTSLGKNEDRLS